jgi:hypothetical protein
MAGWRNVGVGLLVCGLAAVPLAIGSLALARFFDGAALAQITQVVDARLREHAVPPAQLRTARVALSQPTRNGEALLWRAELDGILAGANSRQLQAARSEAIDALKADPANPRTWMLLCELGANLKRSDAGTCFDTAFFVGPFDWYVARRRSVLAADLWPSLDGDTKDAAARRLRLIWETGLRTILWDVAQMPYGRVNIDKAFAHDRTTLHTINYWLMVTPKRPEVDPWGPP